MNKQAMLLAIERIGGPKAVGDALGITRQAVEQWPHVPPKHVLRVEALSGVSRYELRPDIYGDPPCRFQRRIEGNAPAAA